MQMFFRRHCVARKCGKCQGATMLGTVKFMTRAETYDAFLFQFLLLLVQLEVTVCV